jgi:hypothetical protein
MMAALLHRTTGSILFYNTNLARIPLPCRTKSTSVPSSASPKHRRGKAVRESVRLAVRNFLEPRAATSPHRRVANCHAQVNAPTSCENGAQMGCPAEGVSPVDGAIVAAPLLSAKRRPLRGPGPRCRREDRRGRPRVRVPDNHRSARLSAKPVFAGASGDLGGAGWTPHRYPFVVFQAWASRANGIREKDSRTGNLHGQTPRTRLCRWRKVRLP